MWRTEHQDMYIGATLQEVQRAIRSGMFRFAFRRAPFELGSLEARGGGTKVLSPRLFDRIVNMWWKSPPGTKVVLGWIHSDSINYVNVDNGTGYRIVTAVVTRPRTTRRWKNNGPMMSARDTFKDILRTEARVSDYRYRYIDDPGNGEALQPVWAGRNRRRYRTSYFLVWPAGIIDNNKVGNITDTVQTLDMQRHEKILQRYANARLANAEFEGTSTFAFQAAMNNVRRFRQNIKEEKNKERTRNRMKNVMGELRAVPEGAFPGRTKNAKNTKTKAKSSNTGAKTQKFIFPGGTNYLAAKNRWAALIKELESSTGGTGPKKRARTSSGAGPSKQSKRG